MHQNRTRACHLLTMSLENISLSKNLRRCHQQQKDWAKHTFCDLIILLPNISLPLFAIFPHFLPIFWTLFFSTEYLWKRNSIWYCQPVLLLALKPGQKFRHCISHFPPLPVERDLYLFNWVGFPFLNYSKNNARVQNCPDVLNFRCSKMQYQR